MLSNFYKIFLPPIVEYNQNIYKIQNCQSFKVQTQIGHFNMKSKCTLLVKENINSGSIQIKQAGYFLNSSSYSVTDIVVLRGTPILFMYASNLTRRSGGKFNVCGTPLLPYCPFCESLFIACNAKPR